MSQLKDTFDKALKAFNDAKTKTWQDYRDVRQYLDSNVILQRVDDPTAVAGIPDVIINYLNGSQTVLWPYLKVLKLEPEKIVEAIGNLHGTAMYTDKTATPNPSKPYKVRFCFRFRKNFSGDWLLAAALASPI